MLSFLNTIYMKSRRGALPCLALLLLFLFPFSLKGALRPFYLNESESAPYGIYLMQSVESDLQRGERVFVIPPAETRGGERYAAEKLSVFSTLLKKVAGLPGDSYCSKERFVIQGVDFGVSRTLDSSGARIPRIYGCFKVREGHVLLLGDSALSFDSRYFGDIPKDQVLGTAKEILTF